LVGILTSFRKCCSESKNLDKLIFVNKNWSNDLKIGCKALSCLVDLIEIDANLEEDLWSLKEPLKGMKVRNLKFKIEKFVTSYKFSYI
jgi:hypothetical protein